MADYPSKPSLPTFSWVGHLKDDDRELLSSYGEFFPGHPGNVIIEEGVQQTEVFVVISGELEVHSNDEEGNPVLRARVGPGETLGEISLFDPGPALASVTASEFSQLWRIADARLIQFMEDSPGAGNVLLRTLATILAQRLRQVDPTAFGLSAYAVVDSPELEEKETIETPSETVSETDPVVKDEEDEEHVDASVPVAASAEKKEDPGFRPDLSASVPSSIAGAAGAPGRETITSTPPLSLPPKKAPSGDQPLPDSDQLEPL